MPYTRFTAAQVHALHQHYQDYTPTHFAEAWGVEVDKVRALARRHGIKRRAPNGHPVWRGVGASAWASRSRWA